LTNILRHAHARHVDISLSSDGDSLCLQIRDDGVGMHEKIRVGGIGLVSMRERVNALGGEFTIKPARPSETLPGVQIEVKLPLLAHEVGVVL
jgi:signal transduction histidine kinase